MFEKLNFGNLYIDLPSTLTLFAAGKHSGFIIDIDEGNTQMTPIYEADYIPFKVHRMDIGGEVAT